MKNILTYFGIVVTFIGVLLGYIILFGENLFYTKTYTYAIEIGKPVVDLYVLIFSSTIIFQLIVFAFFPHLGKIKLIDTFARFERLRKRVKFVTAFLLAILVILFILSIIRKDWNIFNSGLSLTSFTAFGGVLLYFLYYAISPKITEIGSKLMTPVGRLLSLLGLIIIIVFWLSSIEVIIKGGSEKQQFVTKTPYDKSIPYTNDISFVINDAPQKIKQGESSLIDISFRLTKHDPNATNRFPIVLDTSIQYLLKPNLKTVGFDILPLTDNEMFKEVKLDERFDWKWIISPKDNKEDTKQYIFIDFNLINKKDSSTVFSSPINTITINVNTPLGIPKWVITPDISIGAILAGIITLLFPVFQDKIKFKIQNSAKTQP